MILTEPQRDRLLAAMKAAAFRVLREQKIPAEAFGWGFSTTSGIAGLPDVEKLHLNFREKGGGDGDHQSNTG